MNRILLLVAALLLPLHARAALDVVTTTEGLAALVHEVGGDRVKVQSLSRGIQDPHFVDANPTLAVKLRNADLLVDVGLDLEIGWLPPLVNQSRNANIQPTGSRRFTASSVVSVLEVPRGPVDRSMGDLHPAGNPHFLSDPRRARRVAEGLARKLASLDAAGAATYQKRLADFERRLDADEVRWRAEWAPVKGRKVIPRHNSYIYFLDWAGLQAAGYLEPKPGVAPPPSHLAELVAVAKAQGVKAIILENFYDRKSADVVAKHTGVKVVPLPGDVGGTPEAKTYEAWIDQLVQLASGAVR